jgi:hypothetical protein
MDSITSPPIMGAARAGSEAILTMENPVLLLSAGRESITMENRAGW